MKFQIKHECRGRIRVQAVQQRMTLEQADMLEAWLLTLPQVECASVHERTRCAVIEYQGDRKDLLRILAGFSYQDHALAELVPVPQGPLSLLLGGKGSRAVGAARLAVLHNGGYGGV